MSTHLFLFGSGPPFTEKLGKRFVEVMREKTCIIFVIDRPGINDYRKMYEGMLKSLGVHCLFRPLPAVSEQGICDELKACGGIIIGGGNTEKYIDELVETTIGPTIRDQFHTGIPVAGFSAGAIMSMEKSMISAKDHPSKRLNVRKGLGLQQQTQVAVHFSEWKEEEHLRMITKDYGIEGFGINEKSGIYFKNGTKEMIEGSGVYKIHAGVLHKLEVENR
ncbi:Type 1 glutamine amidotransferase-like domain-containing protein [Shouchella miscanthi]|uniref:Type 1 glutamine amidotransferase-like domain-containing protein n=1 Tax=Shouchella miscanthi TaxID=2598861 RepID=A0ABU6NIN6_9BACI|nr:Type 1 glutamine amidotransferase-like domain-containing protein [Shouchella miscanthi]MED4128058.1 Type 1 glutamine amidotransferase-like domain-containing protein [Shouchella miscanthi]